MIRGECMIMFKWLKSMVKGNENPVSLDLSVSLKDYREPVKRGRPVAFPAEGTKFYYWRTCGSRGYQLDSSEFCFKLFHIAMYKLGNFFLTKEDAYANKDEVVRVFSSSKILK